MFFFMPVFSEILVSLSKATTTKLSKVHRGVAEIMRYENTHTAAKKWQLFSVETSVIKII